MRTECIEQGTLLSALWYTTGKEIQGRGDILTQTADLLCCTVETNTPL